MTETDNLPPAHWLANRIGKELARLRLVRGAGQLGPDGKVIVRVQSDGTHWQPKHVSISLNHHEGSDWFFLRAVAEEAVENACVGKDLPEITLNGAGMFVSGGPTGDNGLSGKKLVVDAYGPTVPIGGGAWSGKDLNKVDRVGGHLARHLALKAVTDYKAKEVVVTLEYIPGCDAPVNIGVVADGQSIGSSMDSATKCNGDVTAMLVEGLPNLQEMARWGHHTKSRSLH